jgi:transcriptional regulator with XRE-family HTH domain
MSPTITNSSPTSTRKYAAEASTTALKIASNSTYIELKTNVQPSSHQIVAGLTNEKTHAFVERLPKWEDREYREGYLEASIEQGVAWQLRAIRKARNLSQDFLAKLLNTKQSAVSRLEDPDYGGHSIETLIKLAHAFGCALSVKFIPYSQLALDSVDLSEKALVVKSFDDEALEFKEKK